MFKTSKYMKILKDISLYVMIISFMTGKIE